MNKDKENEAFYEQLRLQQLYEERSKGTGEDPYSYIDPTDGTEYEWDMDKKAWFPKITDDFLAMYHANYGVDTESQDNSAKSTSADSKQPPDADKSKEEVTQLLRLDLCQYLSAQSVNAAVERLNLMVNKRQLDWKPEKKAGEIRKRFERVIIIKNMFHPSDFEEDPLVLNEIREDLRSECEKFGQVKKVLIFDRHPDGVASVSFKDAEEGDVCTQALNGRWFGGRQLSVETWDGVTDYQIEETSREREERLKGWENFLHTNEKPQSSVAVSEGSSTHENNGHSEDKTSESSVSNNGKDIGGQNAEDGKVNPTEDDAQSTDSSIGSSDDEAV
ncbi:17S U2 SnRNP complex component HTATSF1 [Discoglossus pictus]